MKYPALIALLAAMWMPASASAQTQVSGRWNCANDAGNGVIQTLPPANARIDTKRQHFAPRGSLYEVALARGGPSGMYLRGHLHAIHNDRAGGTNYYAVTLIQDESGYYYAVLPPLQTRVNGTTSRPQRHRHCGGQFPLNVEVARQLQDAIDNGGRITLRIATGREREDALRTFAGSVQSKLKRYLEDEISASELIALLNGG